MAITTNECTSDNDLTDAHTYRRFVGPYNTPLLLEPTCLMLSTMSANNFKFQSKMILEMWNASLAILKAL